ncbi:LptF/LptG family permease [Borrelia anserina]|uniref:Permease n=2 Tax=Borrelia anserina TaxID=143 RepID=A0ABM6FV15_BORAN|nr:LptF/LptG family permease [Borrelia anserina]AHH08779.1 Putative membrane spanning protein [Borrelia anserina BA2]APR65226.1 permease [Borrelia anserina Es]UPA07152.1 LptF/LptG family permease [Borrelia anserina]
MKVDKLFISNISLTFLFMNFLFMVLIVLLDLFTNLFNYIDHNLSIDDIVYIYYLYLPKCFSDGLALSFLFAVSNLIGNLSMRNEIIGLFSCGISIFRILMSIIMLSILISVMLFFFDNYLVIDTVAKRDSFLKNSIGNQGLADRNIIIRNFAREIYNIKHYNVENDTIANLMIILKDGNDNFKKRYDITKAEWVDSSWRLYGVREFFRVDRDIVEKFHEVLDGEGIINLEPEYIKIVMLSSKTLNFSKLISWIGALRRENLDYSEALFDLLSRIFFSFRLILLSFTVGFISLALKKNIFIWSLLNSLAFAVVYVILIMIFSFLADLGYLSIAVASSLPTVLFVIINFVIYNLVCK